jgi:cyclic pyranopterin monophosphate synthase
MAEGQKGRKAGKAAKLSHVDARGRVKMVDVGDKPVTAREAIARGSITMSREALRLIRAGAVKKGDPLQTARLAGILAAKQTSSLIPLCHPLPLSSVHVELTPKARGYEIEARVRTTSQTGVEMEALTAVAVAALTIYDMVKAVDKTMVIGEIRVMSKAGGRSGIYIRQEGRKAGGQKGKGQKGKGLKGKGLKGKAPKGQRRLS